MDELDGSNIDVKLYDEYDASNDDGNEYDAWLGWHVNAYDDAINGYDAKASSCLIETGSSSTIIILSTTKQLSCSA